MAPGYAVISAGSPFFYGSLADRDVVDGSGSGILRRVVPHLFLITE